MHLSKREFGTLKFSFPTQQPELLSMAVKNFPSTLLPRPLFASPRPKPTALQMGSPSYTGGKLYFGSWLPSDPTRRINLSELKANKRPQKWKIRYLSKPTTPRPYIIYVTCRSREAPIPTILFRYL